MARKSPPAKTATKKAPAKAAASDKTKAGAPRKRPARNGEGRPPIYDESFCERARKLCLLYGATDEQLALSFGVALATIEHWKRAHPEFLRAVYAGGEGADVEVAQSTYNRARGYTRRIVKTVGEGEKKITHVTEEEVPGDVTAQRFWMMNRQRKHWRDRTEVEHDVSDKLSDVLAGVDGGSRGLGGEAGAGLGQDGDDGA